MKNSRKFSLFVMPLLVAALGWWLHSANDQTPAPTRVGEATLIEAAEAPLFQVTVLKPEAAEAETFITVDPIASEGDEDPAETLARAVEQMDAAELISRLQKLSLADRRGNLGRLLVRRWAVADPAAAGQWAMQQCDVEARHELSAAVALAWSERDLASALKWAWSLPDDDTRSLVLAGLGYEVARTQPVEALGLAFNLEPVAGRDALILHGLQQWAVADPESAHAWLIQLPEGGMRQRALADFATVLASSDGADAARFAVTQISPGAELDRAVIGVVQRWTQQDLAGTLAWVEQFPPLPLREQAFDILAGIYP